MPREDLRSDEADQLIEQDFITKSAIKAKEVKFRTNTAATDIKLHKMLCRIIKTAKARTTKADNEGLAHVGTRI